MHETRVARIHGILLGALLAGQAWSCSSDQSSGTAASNDCASAQAGMPCSGDTSCMTETCGGGEGFVCVNGKWKLVATDAVLPTCPDAPPTTGSVCPPCWPGAFECKYAEGKRASQILVSGVTFAACAPDGTITAASCDTKTWTVVTNKECRAGSASGADAASDGPSDDAAAEQ